MIARALVTSDGFEKHSNKDEAEADFLTVLSLVCRQQTALERLEPSGLAVTGRKYKTGFAGILNICSYRRSHTNINNILF
jgi:hypothetical protein